MTLLFEPIALGGLTLRNRLMRSATAERVADPQTGCPSPRQGALYRALAEGGVGLIVTGHAYVSRRGKAHPEMAAMDDDALIPAWREVVRPAQAAGARVMIQLNFCGAACDPQVTPEPLSPSGVAVNERVAPCVASEEELWGIIAAFGQAARRAREAGLDGVQLHGAHGYLISQFLTPATNLRTDRWGGNPERRRAFLQAVVAEIRHQVGADYPLWIKLGVAGKTAAGPGLEEGARIAAACAAYGIDAIEISHGLGTLETLDQKGEAAFLPMAEAVRAAVGPDYPLALVYGFRTRQTMEAVLASGVVQLISLCRPLIVEPDLPYKLQHGLSERAACVRCGRCWPEALGEGISCHNTAVKERVQ